MSQFGMRRFLLAFVLLAAGCAPSTLDADTRGAAASASVDLVQSAVWTWFADPRAVRSGDTTYITWHDGAAFWIGAYDEAAQVWATHKLGDTYEDDHNVGSIGIRQDGRIIATWRGAGDDIYLRISTTPGDITAWGATQAIDSGKCSYPNLIYLSSEDRWYLFYRRQDGANDYRPQHLVTSDDDGQTWSTSQVIFANPEARPYHRYATNGVDRIDITTTDGHPAGEPTNSIYHYYYDGTWRSSDGASLGTPPFGPDDVTQVHDGATDDQAWTWDIATDGSNPVIVYATFPTTADHRYRYARWSGSAWVTGEIATAGGTIAPGTSEDRYSGGVVLDHADSGTVYASIQDADGWTLRKLTVATDATVTASVDVATAQGGMKHIRPVVVRGDNRVLWLSGAYAHFTDFDTRLSASPPLTLAVPPRQWVDEPADEVNISSTSWTPGSTTVSTTFVAPASGRVDIDISARLRGNGANRLFVSAAVYEGASAAGALVRAPTDNEINIRDDSDGGAGSATFNDIVSIDGLTPGAVHYVELRHRVSGGSTQDIFHRKLRVSPAS